jgi:hypothetical protein
MELMSLSKSREFRRDILKTFHAILSYEVEHQKNLKPHIITDFIRVSSSILADPLLAVLGREHISICADVLQNLVQQWIHVVDAFTPLLDEQYHDWLAVITEILSTKPLLLDSVRESVFFIKKLEADLDKSRVNAVNVEGERADLDDNIEHYLQKVSFNLNRPRIFISPLDIYLYTGLLFL